MFLYEINTYHFLNRLSAKYGRKLSLGTIPGNEWLEIADRGIDTVWLMGIWQRSPAARREALAIPVLRQQYAAVLPDWQKNDVAGSPYAIYSYTIDPFLGSPVELKQLKNNLAKNGLRLLLDFVPNHLAVDHPWVIAHPEYFVTGTAEDAKIRPELFFLARSGLFLAHGKDPYFPPWSDTVQINFYHEEARQALIYELLNITGLADGVRCDMAMLALNDVFRRTWGETVKDAPPQSDFWTDAISRVKTWKPDFMFIGEVYWGLEERLRGMGFDYTYDRMFYDLLRKDRGEAIKSELRQNPVYHHRCIHFTENHDEPRAMTAFGKERSMAAAAIISVMPGSSMFQEGQFDGKQIRTPVQLGREPVAPPEPEIDGFYRVLLSNTGPGRSGEREIQMLDNKSRDILAWSVVTGESRRVMLVNYSPEPWSGPVDLPLASERVTSVFTGQSFNRTKGGQSFEIELGPYQVQILI